MGRCFSLIFVAAVLLHGQDLLEQSRTYASKRDFVHAISTAQEYVKTNPGSVLGRLTLANAYFMAQQLTDAKQLAVAVLVDQPSNVAALEIKGNAEYLLGEVTPAINTFIDLLERHPENKEAPYMLGRIYYQEGRLDQATGVFERVLKLDPQAYKAYDNLGLCFQAKGDNETAIRYFLTAIKLADTQHADYDVAYANLADLLLSTGDPQKAFDAAAKAADRNPYSARNFYLGGKALERLGKLDLSVNWLQRSAALDPNYAEPQYLLAHIFRKLGQRDKADEAQKKFLEAKAKTPTVRR
jgi:tetratricopeptide (TPR) repeat protein